MGFDDTDSPDLERAQAAARAARTGPNAVHTAEVVADSQRLLRQMRESPIDEFVLKIRQTLVSQRGAA